MKNAIVISFLFAVSAHGAMLRFKQPFLLAACTTAGAGLWSAPATWASCGGGVPGNGDTWTGTHAVTLDDARTVGTSPANCSGTADIQLNNGGQLIITGTGNLTLRGCLKYANPSVARNVIDGSGTGNISFDPTQAASPTTAFYTIGPSVSNTANALIRIQGTSLAQPFTINTLRPNSNEAQGSISLNGFNTALNRTDAQYLAMTDLGSASVEAWSAYTPTLYRFYDYTCNRCGVLNPTSTGVSLGATAVLDMQRGTFSNSTGKNFTFTSAVAMTTGTRLIKGNYFDNPFSTGMAPLNATYQDNVFAVDPNSQFSAIVADFSNNLVIHPGTGTMACNGPFSRNYYINTNGGANGKICQVVNAAAQSVFTDETVEGLTNMGGGDIFVDTRAGTSALTVQLIGYLGLPQTDTVSATVATSIGVPFNGTNANSANFVIQNFTNPGGTTVNPITGAQCSNYGVFMSEGVPNNRANSITSYKANLVWNPTARGTHGCTTNAAPTDNILSAANAINNTCWNCVATTLWAGKDNQNTFYWFPMTGGTTPGSGDINVFPYFADKLRNSVSYATMRGFSPADYTGILAYLATPGVDRASEITRMRNWIRQGYAPFNVRLADSTAPDAARKWHGAVQPRQMFGLINQ